MKKVLFLFLICVGLKCFGGDFDIERLRELPSLMDLQKKCSDRAKKLKGVRQYSFLAHIYRKIYEDPEASQKFDKKLICSIMMQNVACAIKGGDMRTLSELSSLEFCGPASVVCARAMQLLLSRSYGAGYNLHKALMGNYPESYIEKMEAIFGEKVELPCIGIEEDRGRFRANPAVLDFTPETITRLKNFLKDFSAEDEVKNVLSSALDIWCKVCEKTDCSKVYQEIHCMKFKGFDI